MNNLRDWLKDLPTLKENFLCVWVYEMNAFALFTFALFTAEAWKK